MRQPADDRALYYRQLRATVADTFLPELSSATALDAAGLVDRILAEFIVEEEWADVLSQEFGAAFEALLPADGSDRTAVVTPARFDDLRRQAAVVVSQRASSDAAEDQASCRQLVDVERRFLEQVDELRRLVLDEKPDAEAASSLTQCSVTPAQLSEYLRSKLPASPDLAVAANAGRPGRAVQGDDPRLAPRYDRATRRGHRA